MSDQPTMVILGVRRRGRPTRSEAASTRRIEFVMTEAERTELERVAAENRQPLSTLIREAVNEFVSDYRDQAVFVPRRRRV